MPRPFCEVLALLEPVQTHADAHAFGFAARSNKASTPLVYTEGEDLLIEVTTPAQFESYIYVDFYDSDGRVHYLFFNPELNRPFPPQSVHTLGYADGQPVWGIGPPYGRGLVTVIASKTPLVFPPLEPRDDPGSAALYLARLRQALPQDVARPRSPPRSFSLRRTPSKMLYRVRVLEQTIAGTESTWGRRPVTAWKDQWKSESRLIVRSLVTALVISSVVFYGARGVESVFEQWAWWLPPLGLTVVLSVGLWLVMRPGQKRPVALRLPPEAQQRPRPLHLAASRFSRASWRRSYRRSRGRQRADHVGTPCTHGPGICCLVPVPLAKPDCLKASLGLRLLWHVLLHTSSIRRPTATGGSFRPPPSSIPVVATRPPYPRPRIMMSGAACWSSSTPLGHANRSTASCSP